MKTIQCFCLFPRKHMKKNLIRRLVCEMWTLGLCVCCAHALERDIMKWQLETIHGENETSSNISFWQHRLSSTVFYWLSSFVIICTKWKNSILLISIITKCKLRDAIVSASQWFHWLDRNKFIDAKRKFPRSKNDVEEYDWSVCVDAEQCHTKSEHVRWTCKWKRWRWLTNESNLIRIFLFIATQW